MERTAAASIEFALSWVSPAAAHRDRLVTTKVNFWRDSFPGALKERLQSLPIGEEARVECAAGELVPAYDESGQRQVPLTAFRRRVGSRVIEPRAGRFYPRGFVADALGTFAADLAPMRVIGRSDDELRIDLNHPLARYPVQLAARVTEVMPTREERGGSANDVGDLVTAAGPGMQAPFGTQPTDFFTSYPFAREDESSDALFYREPRLVQHIDARAAVEVSAIYARLLPTGGRVLDLMASWVSHLPPQRADLKATGLGMNAVELERNSLLETRVVHDLNVEPMLPFADGVFDAVVCTVSFEYLRRPLEVFADVARVLRPGGVFVNALSERWFPPKAIALWGELHPFERLGLVLECYRRTGAFAGLCTDSVRGLPRPADDRHAATLAFADPIYAVWGYRI